MYALLRHKKECSLYKSRQNNILVDFGIESFDVLVALPSDFRLFQGSFLLLTMHRIISKKHEAKRYALDVRFFIYIGIKMRRIFKYCSTRFLKKANSRKGKSECA